MKDRLIATASTYFFKLMNSLIFTILICPWISSYAFADENSIFTLGEIGNQTVSEGELLNFNVRPPASFGPNVKWTVAGFPEDNIFYDVPAFPGAEGFGAGTTGGRGGKVVKVTNLNRSGEGSLAAALAMKEPRIIVFDVSGVIEGALPQGEWIYAKSGRIYTQNAPITIAGQTAPGGGVTINGELMFISGDGGTYTDNVIARFLRTRSPYYRTNLGDAILLGGHSAVLDHVSGAWGDDETFDLSNLKNASIQWCGIEESAGSGVEWEVMTDSDKDGMPDSWERKVRSYDLNDAITDFITQILPDDDLDHDGMTNLEEYKAGSNPLVANANPSPEWTHLYDSDNDGLADWWEQQVISFNTTDNLVGLEDINPEDDLDGDLNTNLEEYKDGSNPLQKPTHNYGMIMGYDGRNISLHHNFFAHHSDRNPLSGIEVLDNRNNIVYNPDLGASFHPVTMNNQRPGELFKTNVINNYYKVGPNSTKLLSTPTYFFPFISSSDRASIYDAGNYFDMLDSPFGYFNLNESGLRRGIYSGFSYQQSLKKFLAPDVETQSAELAYKLVLSHGGALPHDKITSRNINEIKTRTGKWGKHFPEGGLMEGLPVSAPPIDSDNDGMPDAWETQSFVLNDHTVINRKNILDQYTADNNRIVRDGESALVYNGEVIPGTENRYKGYTYIEYYINELADKMILQQLYADGFDETYLPGYGKQILPTVSWIPTYSQAGIYNVTFTATDDTGQTLSQTIQVKVENTDRKAYIYPAMYTPEGSSISTISENKIEIGKIFKFNFYVTDVDGDDFTVSINNLPNKAKFIDTGRTEDSLKGDSDYRIFQFEWEPCLDDVGKTGNITINVTSSNGETTSKLVLYKIIAASKPVYTIKSSYTGEGSVAPLGETYVQEGDSRAIIFTPNEGYTVSDVLIDGASIGAVPVYVFKNVTTNHNIEVNFKYNPNAINGLILKLDFNGNAQDYSGLKNDGEINGAVLTNDRFGNSNSAYSFDGVDDYIKVKDNDYFNLSEYTISVWVYGTEDFNIGQYFISKGSRDGSNAIGLFSVWDSLFASGTTYPHIETALQGKENQWLHIVIARTLTSVEFFINGQSLGKLEAGYNEDNDLDLLIGAKASTSTPSKFFKGALDDIRIYNRALTPDEIAKISDTQVTADSIYSIQTQTNGAGTITPSGTIQLSSGNDQNFTITPQGGFAVSEVMVDGVSVGPITSYAFENVSTNHIIAVDFKEISDSSGQNETTTNDLLLKLDFSGNMKDSSGLGHDGVSSGDNSPQLTYDRFGNPDSAYLFDGLNDYIRINHTNDFNSAEYTISAWINGEKDFYEGQTILSKNSGDSVDTLGMFTLWDKLYSPGTGYPHTSNILADKEHQWTHVSVVKKSNMIEFFINGISQGAVQAGATKDNTLDLIIGARANTSIPNIRFFKGAIDDINIYNHALTADEIFKIYEIQSTANKTYTITTQTNGSGTITPSGSIKVLSSGDQSFNFIPQNGFSVSDVVIDGVSAGPITSYNFEAISCNHTIAVIFTELSTSSNQDSSIIHGLVLKLDFSGNMKDSSGLGHDGVSSGDNSPQLTYDRFGNPDSAYLLDGLNDYIRIKNTNDFNSAEYTISAWINGEKDFYEGQTIISKNSGDSVDTLGMFILWDKLYSPGAGYPHTSTNILADKERHWTHVSVVKKSNMIEFFINGISQGAVQAGATKDNTLDLIIGARANTSTPNVRFFKGAIDDIRVYTRALSTDEIFVLTNAISNK